MLPLPDAMFASLGSVYFVFLIVFVYVFNYVFYMF
jgi:hypothetical protein